MQELHLKKIHGKLICMSNMYVLACFIKSVTLLKPWKSYLLSWQKNSSMNLRSLFWCWPYPSISFFSSRSDSKLALRYATRNFTGKKTNKNSNYSSKEFPSGGMLRFFSFFSFFPFLFTNSILKSKVNNPSSKNLEVSIVRFFLNLIKPNQTD